MISITLTPTQESHIELARRWCTRAEERQDDGKLAPSETGGYVAIRNLLRIIQHMRMDPAIDQELASLRASRGQDAANDPVHRTKEE